MCELRIELVHYLQLHYSTQFNVIPEHQQDMEKLRLNACVSCTCIIHMCIVHMYHTHVHIH